MSKILSDCRYSKDHEWVKIKEGKAYVGITDYAQASLGEIVYVETPKVGDHLALGDDFCNIESVKAASPIINPLAGDVVEVNKSLEGQPELLNQNCYDNYIYALDKFNQSEFDALMDSSQYELFLQSK
ncbi:MAG: glycine cleavage system protein GcvH [Sphaerochaetaceae bacterium]|jgi:glycine cleavage system H protein